jgi:hypothetical protein
MTPPTFFSSRGRSFTWGVLAFLVLDPHGAASQTTRPQLPARVESYLTQTVKLTSDDLQRLTKGDPVTKLLEADESNEVAVLGAVWINAQIRRYVDAVKDIESFERGGGFKVTKRISSPPRLEDFAALRLSDEDLGDLRTCRVGDCQIKLGEPALERFRSEIDWKAPDARAAANALMQRLALEYVTRYLEGGNDQLAVYRDSSRPTFVAREFREMTDRMPELSAYMPDIRRYLLEYPRVTIPGAESFLYWQETEFGLKPTFRVSHLTIREGPSETIVTSKMLYASHYFWTGLELRVLVPDASRGNGFWFITVNRSRSDGLGGFTGAFVRPRVRSEVESGTLAALRSTKQRLEALR